jgi:hypothetical protein
MPATGLNARFHLLEFTLEPNSPWRAIDLSAVLGEGEVGGRLAVHVQDGGRTRVWGRTLAGTLVHFHRPAGGPWELVPVSDRVGGQLIAGAPAIVGTDAYVRADHGRLLRIGWNYGATVWETDDLSAATGRTIAADPEVQADGGAIVSIFAQDDNNQLLQFYLEPGQPWQAFDITQAAGGGSAVGRAAVTADSTFTRSAEGHLLQFYWNPAGAGAWELWDVTAMAGGGLIAGDPVTHEGLNSIYARGADDHLLQFYWNPAGAGSWEVWDITALAGGGLIADEPSVGLDGRDVFARTVDGQLVQFYLNPATGTWELWNLSLGVADCAIDGPPAQLGGPIYVAGDCTEVHGDIRAKWASFGYEAGWLGQPICDETGTGDGVGSFNVFQQGAVIFRHPALGAFEVHGGIRVRWDQLGGASAPSERRGSLQEPRRVEGCSLPGRIRSNGAS